MNTEHTFLNTQRLIGDIAADELVKDFFAANNAKLLYQNLQKNATEVRANGFSNPVCAFLLSHRPTPDWYDSEKIDKGQRFFYNFAMPIMTLLGGLALPYCYAASPGNKALYLSDKMRQSTSKRLIDTAEFIIGVCSPNTFKESSGNIKTSDAQIFINKIRLIHALARYYITTKAQWEMAWGLPINQEDMAGTNLAFSYIILSGLNKTAHSITEKQKENFMFLWRYIGYQLYIDENLLPVSFSEGAVLERTIRKRHFKKSEEGVVLTKELLDYYVSVAPQSQVYLLEAQIRYWLGPNVADCLGLDAQPLKDALVGSINFFRESSAFFNTASSSYDLMLSNHKMLKSKVKG